MLGTLGSTIRGWVTSVAAEVAPYRSPAATTAKNRIRPVMRAGIVTSTSVRPPVSSAIAGIHTTADSRRRRAGGSVARAPSDSSSPPSPPIRVQSAGR